MILREKLIAEGNYLFKKRSVIPLYILVIGILVKCYEELFETSNVIAFNESYDEIIALAIAIFGLIIRAYTVAHTPRYSSGKHTKDGPSAKYLNTTGAYSLVRHPLYVGNFFLWFGVTLLTDNFWFITAFVFFYFLYYERIILKEEEVLISTFGDQYIAWSKKVGIILPNFKNFCKPSVPFSWKKILKSEKNALAAVGLIFWFFNGLEIVLRNQSFTITYNFWFYFMLFTNILYIILKILKKQRVLDEENR